MKPKKIRNRENTEKILIMLWPLYPHRYPDLPFEKIRALTDSQIESIDFQMFINLRSAMELTNHYIYD